MTKESKFEPYGITVKQLIEALDKLNPNYIIVTEGCDCFGFVLRVEQNDADKEVCLFREKVGDFRNGWSE